MSPRVWPFHDLTESELASTKVRAALPLPVFVPHSQSISFPWYVKKVDFSTTPIRAIFVYHDPRNWALDTQIICDVLQSGGIIGGAYQPSPNDRNVELIFCNPDLLWRNEFDRPRIGQGGFRVAFQAVYKVCCHSHSFAWHCSKEISRHLVAGRVGTNRLDVSVHAIWQTDSGNLQICRKDAA